MRIKPVLLIPFLFVCCINQGDYSLDSAAANPLVDIPLVAGVLSIQDILHQTDSAYVHVGADSILYLDYSTTLISSDLQKQFQIPDKLVDQNFFLKAEAFPAHNTDLRIDSVNLQVDLGLYPQQLSGIDFKAGTLNFATQISTADAGLGYDVIITSSDFISKSTGNTLSITAGQGSVPLQDYRLALVDNVFNLKMVLVYKASPDVTIHNNAAIAIQFSLKDIEFNSIKGFFGDHQFFPIPAVITIAAFGESLHSAKLSVVNPNVVFKVVNDYGVPLTIDFLEFDAKKTGASLNGQLSPTNPIAILYPATLGTSAITDINVTNGSQMVDFGPQSFHYTIGAEINKGVYAGNNFMADTSKLRVNLNVNIPLYGQVSKVALSDTSSIDLSKLNQSQVESASLLVMVGNQLPLNAIMQIYLADSHYAILDSLLSPSQTALIKGSTVSSSGDLQTTGVTNMSVPLNQVALDKLFTTPYLIIKASLASSTDASGKSVDVKFKADYTMKINLGLSVKIKASVKF